MSVQCILKIFLHVPGTPFSVHCTKKCPTVSVSGNSLDKLCHTISVAYVVELVLLNKHQISGGGAYLHCHPVCLWVVSVQTDEHIHIFRDWYNLRLVNFERH